MASLEKIRKTAESTLEAEFWQAAEAASKEEPTRTKAAIKIQAVLKGYLLRKKMKNLRKCATQIQKCYRGKLGRVRFANHQRSLAQHEREKFFHVASIEIQRHWRGRFSRKFIHDFYARKNWLASIQKANEDLRQQMAQNYEEQVIYLENQAHADATQNFKAHIKGKHHLLSTKSCRGVFNSKYAALKPGGVPAFSGVPVEQYLAWESQTTGKVMEKILDGNVDQQVEQITAKVEKDMMFHTTFSSEEMFSSLSPDKRLEEE